MQTKKSRLQELDALRGVAALGVVLFHFTMTNSAPYAKFLRIGATGVHLFFIISGFVIFMSINKIRESREFVVNRFARLYPIYWTCVTLAFLLQTVLTVFHFHKGVGAHNLAQYGANMTMLQHFLGFQDIDGSYWTLTVELIFYVFIYILLRLRQVDRIENVSLGVVIALGLLQNIPLPAVYNFYSALNKALPICIYFPLFLAGIVFYKIFSDKPTVFRYVIIGLCFAVQLSNFSFIVYYFTFAQYATALVIYFSLFLLFVNNKLSFIVSRPSVFLGSISYAVYLVHQVFCCEFLLPFLHNRLHLNLFTCYVIGLTSVILLATFITRYIEMPVRDKIKNALKKSKSTQVPVSQ